MAIKAGMDRVLVTPEEAPEETDFGFVIPKGKRSPNPVTGIVTAIGKPLHYAEAPQGLEVGDRVFFKDMAGAEFKRDGVKYYALLFEEIAGYEKA